MFTLFFSSCKKESIISETTTEKNVLSTNSTSPCITESDIYYNFHGITIAYERDNNIIRFNNWEDYDNAVKLLDKEYDNHNYSRDLLIPDGLTDEEMDDLDDAAGFDPFFSYKQLEHQFSGFTSKRQIIEETENS